MYVPADDRASNTRRWCDSFRSCIRRERWRLSRAHLIASDSQANFRADSCGYNETNLVRRRFEIEAPALKRRVPDAAENLARLMHQHPMVVHNRHSDQRALKMSDLLSQRQFHRLELYDTVYRPGRVEFLMTGGFNLARAGDIVTLAMGRESKDFSEDDRDMLNLVRPHLQQAYANADAMTTFQSQLEGREQLLEEPVNAAVVLVREMAIKQASRLAIDGCRASSDAAVEDQLPDRIRRWLRFCQDSVEGKQSEPKPCAPLMVESGEGRLNIRMLETRPDGDVVLLLSREGWRLSGRAATAGTGAAGIGSLVLDLERKDQPRDCDDFIHHAQDRRQTRRTHPSQTRHRNSHRRRRDRMVCNARLPEVTDSDRSLKPSS